MIFHCFTPNATDIFWRINGATRGRDFLQTQGIKTMINQTIHESSLIIPSTVANNNTSIVCRAGHDDGMEYRIAASNKAMFYVQGQLSIVVVCKLLMIKMAFPPLQVHWESVMTYKLTHLETTTSVSHGILHRPST